MSPGPIIVLEEASLGRSATKARIPDSENDQASEHCRTVLGFGPYSQLTYQQLLQNPTIYKDYVVPKFGRYRYIPKQAQNITIALHQQALEFVPAPAFINRGDSDLDQDEQTTASSTSDNDNNNNDETTLPPRANELFEWLQTQEAGRIYERTQELEFQKKSYAVHQHRSHGNTGMSACCPLM
mmetsp:Transcript_2740/g.7666  ORF Transcript_2740/g.7666 Transcript_2740/m.7666 type:complete len:183 (+) Transcript_2740:86-634(+)